MIFVEFVSMVSVSLNGISHYLNTFYSYKQIILSHPLVTRGGNSFGNVKLNLLQMYFFFFT